MKKCRFQMLGDPPKATQLVRCRTGMGDQEPPEILGLMELAVALVMVKYPAGLT